MPPSPAVCSASLFLPFAPSLRDVPSALVYFADSRHFAGKKEDGREEDACAGRLKWRRPRAFALLGFLPSPSSTFFPPLRLAHRDSHGRPFRYSFVSWRLPSCPLMIPSRSLSLFVPFQAWASFFCLLRTNLLAFSSVSCSSLHCRASGPYVWHSCVRHCSEPRHRFTTLFRLHTEVRTLEGSRSLHVRVAFMS